jgi:hypothetical protein
MSEDNILPFSAPKKREKKPSQNSYDLELARHIVRTDPVLSALIKKLQITVDDAAVWMVDIVKLRSELDAITIKYAEKSDHSPFFMGLVAQVMAMEAAICLDMVGQHPEISKETFHNFQSNAIFPIVQCEHGDSAQKESFDGFKEKDKHDDREPEP